MNKIVFSSSCTEVNGEDICSCDSNKHRQHSPDSESCDCEDGYRNIYG